MKIATMERMNDQIENTLETLRKENRALEKTLEMLDSKPITKDNRKRYGTTLKHESIHPVINLA